VSFNEEPDKKRAAGKGATKQKLAPNMGTNTNKAQPSKQSPQHQRAQKEVKESG
jgi:hypothetical protein